MTYNFIIHSLLIHNVVFLSIYLDFFKGFSKINTTVSSEVLYIIGWDLFLGNL